MSMGRLIGSHQYVLPAHRTWPIVGCFGEEEGEGGGDESLVSALAEGELSSPAGGKEEAQGVLLHSLA